MSVELALHAGTRLAGTKCWARGYEPRILSTPLGLGAEVTAGAAAERGARIAARAADRASSPSVGVVRAGLLRAAHYFRLARGQFPARSYLTSSGATVKLLQLPTDVLAIPVWNQRYRLAGCGWVLILAGSLLPMEP